MIRNCIDLAVEIPDSVCDTTAVAVGYRRVERPESIDIAGYQAIDDGVAVYPQTFGKLGCGRRSTEGLQQLNGRATDSDMQIT